MLTTLLVFAFVMAAEASVGSKQVKVDYNNFKIFVNGNAVNLSSSEPFSMNGTIYLPLRVVGEALNSTVNWQNETKTVSITPGATAEVTSLRLQLTSKDQEIANLKKQVADLQAQAVDEDDLSDLESDLIDDYDEIGDVAVEDITLDGDEDEVDVLVEVDLDDYEDEWADLSDWEIKAWIDDLVGDIQDELSDDTEVNGEIVDIDSDDTLVEFSKDGSHSLDVDFEDDDYRNAYDVDDVEDDLDGDSYDVGGIDFYIDSIRYHDSYDEIRVSMASDEDVRDDWEDLSDSTIEGDVEDICADIADAFIDDADVDPEYVIIYFYDENDDLLGQYEYDVDDESLD